MKLYPRLAWQSIRKNKRLYLPYLLTCIGMVMMYVIIRALSMLHALTELIGGAVIATTLYLGAWVIAAFSLLFLFYTNSFLLKRREKEFGLYSVLGMGKRNIVRILFWEMLIVAGISLAAGLFLGVLFSKLAELILLRLVHGTVSYSLTVRWNAVLQTLEIYSGIFVLIFLNSIRRVGTAGTAELLKRENEGEKPPRANWFAALLGAVLLGGAYWLAVIIDDPIVALLLFFVAVLMVIAATYLLMIAGSVTTCKILQKNRKFYYKKENFVSVSSLAYRMKRSGAGLASICILATMVLVTMAGTACLYFGMERSLSTRYPRDLVMITDAASPEELNTEFREEMISAMTDGLSVSDEMDFTTAGAVGVIEKDRFLWMQGACQLYFISAADYNRVMGTELSVADGEAVLCCMGCTYREETLNVAGTVFRITGSCEPFRGAGNYVLLSQMVPTMMLVVPEIDECLLPLREEISSFVEPMYIYQWCYGVNTSADRETVKGMLEGKYAALLAAKNGADCQVQLESRAANEEDFYTTFGGLFFIGMALSIVFLFATVLILYYKQMVEGYEDQGRFAIMQKVGMTRRDIRKSVNAQMRIVFFLPLAMAALHVGFAFPMLRRIMLLFNLYDTQFLLLVTVLTVAVFALFYLVVYRLTARAYYSVVSGGER